MGKIIDLDKIALNYLGIENVNKTPSPDRGVLQATLSFWLSQSNLSAIFATIFSSTFIVVFVETEGCSRLASVPFLILTIHFLMRAWAYGRCAKITVRIWL